MKVINKPTHGSLEWLNLRHRDEDGRVRFGASEAPVLMGVSKYRTITDLAIEKWSIPEVKEQNEAMMRGHLLEPALIQYASQLMGIEVATPEEMFSVGRMIATLDGISPDGVTIVEAKTTTRYSSDDPLPEEYLWQGVAQMACRPDADGVLFVVLDKRQRLGHWMLNRDEDLISELMLRADEVGDLLDAHTLPDDAIVREDHVKALYPTPKGSTELGAIGISLVGQWMSAKQAKEDAERMEQDARDALTAMLGDAEIGTVDGQQIVSFKSRSTGSRWDTKRLEQEHPELAITYKKQAGTTRVLKALGE